MFKNSKEAWLEDGCYKEIPDKEDMPILFRKFDNAVWIVQFNDDMNEQIGMVRIPMETFKLIVEAPSIVPGDGKTPQRLAGEIG